jgi:hypothetical protein
VSALFGIVNVTGLMNPLFVTPLHPTRNAGAFGVACTLTLAPARKLPVAQPTLLEGPEYASVPAPAGVGSKVRGQQSTKFAVSAAELAGILNAVEGFASLNPTSLVHPANACPPLGMATRLMDCPNTKEPAEQKVLAVGDGGLREP